MRKILIGWGALGTVSVALLVVGILAVLNGCSGGSASTESSSGGETQAPSTTSSQSSQASTNTNKEYSVGDSIDLSDRTLKVNEEQANYLPLNPSSKPEPGNQFVRVNVTITNNSSGQINFTPFDFQLEDASGVQRGYAIAVDMPNPLNTGNLAPNDSITGNIAFQAPQGDAGFKLIYKPIASPSETATVKV